MSSRLRLAVTLVCAAGLAASCTSGSGSAGPTAPARTVTTVITRTPPPPTPVATGPKHTADAPACPLIDQQTAANDVGMRLARITVTTAGRSVIGCDFYALQGSPLSVSEHLPGPNQPALRIAVTRYPTATAARAALVLAAQPHPSAQSASIPGADSGASWQTAFYAADAGRDWAVGFTKGAAVIVVTAVVTDSNFNAVQVAHDLVGRF